MTQEMAEGAAAEQWKHGRLHEFQARLLQRMEAARDGSGMRDSRLGVAIGDHHCLLDLREASEIASLMPITKVPLTKDWYLGLANVRGNLIGVVDLPRFFGGQPQVRNKESRVIVVSPNLFSTCGFMVSRVLGLRHIQEMTQLTDAVKAHTDVIDKAPALSAGNRYLDHDGQEWTEIRLATIVGDSRFLQVGL